jgi:hypothetical protein
LLLWEQYFFAFLTFILNWNHLTVALILGKKCLHLTLLKAFLAVT